MSGQARVGTNPSIARVLRALDTGDPSVRLHVDDDHEFVATHLDRVYWPEVAGLQPPITKRDHLRYLATASPAITGGSVPAV